jgi:SAM-dependent methyltransferase
MSRDRGDWNELAELDPLWAVLSDPSRKGGRWELDEFLATGEREVDAALASAAALDLPGSRGRALDIGCGVGRLTRALAGRFESALGVDGSETMVAHAERINADLPNCTFRALPAAELGSLEPASFDLVLSLLVLQHLPPADAERAIGRSVSLLRPHGIAIFQLPYATRPLHRLQLSRRLYRIARATGVSADLLHRRTPLTPMRMNALHEERVRELVEASGGAVLAVEPYGPQDLPTPSRLYLAAGAD